MTTPTIRPTTTGSRRPARVRFEPEQARTYRRLLGEERHRTVIQRAECKAAGEERDVSDLNRVIEGLDRMSEELVRACEERGWRLS